jgi:hypothetical protein
VRGASLIDIEPADGLPEVHLKRSRKLIAHSLLVQILIDLARRFVHLPGKIGLTTISELGDKKSEVSAPDFLDCHRLRVAPINRFGNTRDSNRACQDITVTVIRHGMDHAEYLNTLSPSERRELARQLKCSSAFIEQLLYRCKRPGPKFAQQLNAASGGKAELAKMRPDIWGGIAA